MKSKRPNEKEVLEMLGCRSVGCVSRMFKISVDQVKEIMVDNKTNVTVLKEVYRKKFIKLHPFKSTGTLADIFHCSLATADELKWLVAKEAKKERSDAAALKREKYKRPYEQKLTPVDELVGTPKIPLEDLDNIIELCMCMDIKEIAQKFDVHHRSVSCFVSRNTGSTVNQLRFNYRLKVICDNYELNPYECAPLAQTTACVVKNIRCFIHQMKR